MNALDYIKSLDTADFRIEKCQRKIERLEIIAQNLSSKPFDNDRVKSSGSKDRIGDLAVRIIEEKNHLAKLMDEIEEKREYVISQIDKIEDLRFQKIIYYRHIDKTKYEDIADILDLAPKTVRDYYSKAMKEYERVFVMP